MIIFRIIPVLFLCLYPFLAHAAGFGAPHLEIVAQIKERPGNIAVARDGRMFISVHPFDSPVYKVMEVKTDGTTRPYPDEHWAAEPGSTGIGLANVIHLTVVGDLLYILDSGDTRVQPKLMAWDIAQNKLARIWYIPRHAVTEQSFLQDFVMTPDARTAFIADMGQADLAGKPMPAIIYLNMETGEAWRLLESHPGVRPSARPMRAAGGDLKLSKEGKQFPLYLALNPITMDPTGTWVYFAPMGEGGLYKVLVADLTNLKLSPDDLARRVTIVGLKPPGDGMIIDGKENIFMTSVVDGAIGVMNNKGKYTTWLRDPLLMWPDGLAFGPDNGLYATVNQLHLAAPFNGGEDKSTPPYMIVRIMGGRPM